MKILRIIRVIYFLILSQNLFYAGQKKKELQVEINTKNFGNLCVQVSESAYPDLSWPVIIIDRDLSSFVVTRHYTLWFVIMFTTGCNSNVMSCHCCQLVIIDSDLLLAVCDLCISITWNWCYHLLWLATVVIFCYHCDSSLVITTNWHCWSVTSHHQFWLVIVKHITS